MVAENRKRESTTTPLMRPVSPGFPTRCGRRSKENYRSVSLEDTVVKVLNNPLGLLPSPSYFLKIMTVPETSHSVP